MSIIKSQIESLGFSFLHKTKRDGLYYAFNPMGRGILIDGKEYQEVLDNIERYFKDMYPIEDNDDYEEDEEFVIGCNKCGKDVTEVNAFGTCNKCSKK